MVQSLRVFPDKQCMHNNVGIRNIQEYSTQRSGISHIAEGNILCRHKYCGTYKNNKTSTHCRSTWYFNDMVYVMFQFKIWNIPLHDYVIYHTDENFLEFRNRMRTTETQYYSAILVRTCNAHCILKYRIFHVNQACIFLMAKKNYTRI